MHLPFKTEHAPGKPDLARKWLEFLDDLGMENVRLRLAQNGGEQNDTLRRAGSDIAVPRGFAEDWLRFRDRRSHTIEQRWRWAIFIPAAISAIAACTAGAVTLGPHALHRLRAALPASAPRVAAAPAPAGSPTPGTAGWQPLATDEYTVVNGNIYQAETGPRPESIQIHQSPDIVRFQMIPGNTWAEDASDVERTELDGYKQPFEQGTAYWLAFSLYIEPGPRITADWMGLGQSPGLMGHLVKNSIMSWLLQNKTFHNETIRPGQNYQFVEKIVIDPVNGYWGAWFNGKQVVDYHGRVGDAGKRYFYKFGIYRGVAQETMTARYANFKFGTADLTSLIANPDPPPPLVPWP